MVNLTDIASRYRVIADTSSLMHPRGTTFFTKAFTPALKQHGTKLVLYSSVAREIDKHISSNHGYRRRAAQNAALIVKYLTKLRLIELVEERGTFADFVLVGEIYKLRRYVNTALVCQDRELAYDVLRLKDMRSSRYPTDIQTFRLAETGELVNWKDTLPPHESIQPINEAGQGQQLSSIKKMIGPAISTSKAIHTPKPLPARQRSRLVMHANKETVEKKLEIEAVAFFQKTLVATPGLVNQESSKAKKSENSNILENILRSVSQTFRHQRRIVGSNR